MVNPHKTHFSTRRDMSRTTPLLMGLAGGLAVLAGLTMMRNTNKSRRYGDRTTDRRKPTNMFAAGVFPQRRRIDRSGERPLFERRQSAYDSY